MRRKEKQMYMHSHKNTRPKHTFVPAAQLSPAKYTKSSSKYGILFDSSLS